MAARCAESYSIVVCNASTLVGRSIRLNLFSYCLGFFDKLSCSDKVSLRAVLVYFLK